MADRRYNRTFAEYVRAVAGVSVVVGLVFGLVFVVGGFVTHGINGVGLFGPFDYPGMRTGLVYGGSVVAGSAVLAGWLLRPRVVLGSRGPGDSRGPQRARAWAGPAVLPDDGDPAAGEGVGG